MTLLRAAIAAAILLSVIYRSRRIPVVLEEVARRLKGRVERGGLWRARPLLSGEYQGHCLKIDFPVRWAFSRGQALRLHLAVPAGLELQVRSGHAAEELGFASTGAAQLHYLFETHCGSELLIADGWATMTLRWSWEPEALTPEALMIPITQFVTLVDQIVANSPRPLTSL